MRDCWSVELRALCNEVPRTPPGPEGSNGIGNASGAADHPKFLSPEKFPVHGCYFLTRKSCVPDLWFRTTDDGKLVPAVPSQRESHCKMHGMIQSLTTEN